MEREARTLSAVRQISSTSLTNSACWTFGPPRWVRRSRRVTGVRSPRNPCRLSDAAARSPRYDLPSPMSRRANGSAVEKRRGPDGLRLPTSHLVARRCRADIADSRAAEPGAVAFRHRGVTRWRFSAVGRRRPRPRNARAHRSVAAASSKLLLACGGGLGCRPSSRAAQSSSRWAFSTPCSHQIRPWRAGRVFVGGGQSRAGG